MSEQRIDYEDALAAAYNSGNMDLVRAALRQAQADQECLFRIALNGCGIPGHSVAVGCGSNGIAAKHLGVMGMTEDEARRALSPQEPSG